MVKWIVINSLGENTRKIIEGQGKTANQIWSILEKSFTTSPEKRKLELKRKINSLKFNEDEDINIFMATLQNSLEELENIDQDIGSNVKAGILNRCLPENLRFINVFQFKNDWNKLCSYVKSVIPDIVFSNLKESSNFGESKQQLFLTQSGHTSNIPSKSERKEKEHPKYKNGKCYRCGRFGHYSRECWKNIRRNTSKYNKKFPKNKKKVKWNKNINKNFHKNNKYKDNNQQINSIEKTTSNNTNSNTSFKDYNSNDSIFLGCITTESRNTFNNENINKERNDNLKLDPRFRGFSTHH